MPPVIFYRFAPPILIYLDLFIDTRVVSYLTFNIVMMILIL